MVTVENQIKMEGHAKALGEHAKANAESMKVNADSIAGLNDSFKIVTSVLRRFNVGASAVMHEPAIGAALLESPIIAEVTYLKNEIKEMKTSIKNGFEQIFNYLAK